MRPPSSPPLPAVRRTVAAVTLDDPAAAVRAVRALRAAAPNTPIVARARDVGHSAILEAGGASETVPEILEGSLQVGGSVLRALNRPIEAVEDEVRAFRRAAPERLSDLIPVDPSADP